MTHHGDMPAPFALSDLPPWALDKQDPDDDAAFYADARLVTHIDDGAIAALTDSIAACCRRAACCST